MSPSRVDRVSLVSKMFTISFPVSLHHHPHTPPPTRRLSPISTTLANTTCLTIAQQILTALLTTTILSLQTTSHPTAATQDPDNTGIIAGPMGAAALLPPPTPVWADFFRVIGYQSIGCSRGQKDSLLDADPAAKQGKVNQCVDLPKPANSHRIRESNPFVWYLFIRSLSSFGDAG